MNEDEGKRTSDALVHVPEISETVIFWGMVSAAVVAVVVIAMVNGLFGLVNAV